MTDDGFEDDLPCDIAAERYVLAAMLTNPAAIDEVTEILDPVMFYRPGHQVIYRAVISMRGQGIGVSPITLREELTRHEEIQAIGGARQGPLYLAELNSLPVLWMAAATEPTTPLPQRSGVQRGCGGRDIFCFHTIGWPLRCSV